MLPCYYDDASQQSTPITVLTTKDFETWLSSQSDQVQRWVKANQFSAKADSFCLLPGEQGDISSVLLGVGDDAQYFWAMGLLPGVLPAGFYHLDESSVAGSQVQRMPLAWGLGSYQTKPNKKNGSGIPQLLLPASAETEETAEWVKSICWVRELINTPCEDMGPPQLAAAAQQLTEQFNAKVVVYSGDALLEQNYPTVHAVGRAGARPPCLIDVTWGNPEAPKVTLVGKGVCFDTGGLNLKPAGGMRGMKKDMGGAAHVLGLARMLMQQQLPICLRVLIPAVENAVSANSYRPGDILTTRSGIKVEVHNTDAEGRLVLCDALTAAIEEQPDLIIDVATLTGAARVALGPDVPVFFANDDQIASDLTQAAATEQDLIWRLPLYQPYMSFLKSDVADCTNAASTGYGGAITAALYLQQFVKAAPWVHFDLMAWNDKTTPGRPVGGEAMGLRAMFEFLRKRYS